MSRQRQTISTTFEVSYWAPDPQMPGVQVPGNGVWMSAVSDIEKYGFAQEIADQLRGVYVKVRIERIDKTVVNE